MSRKPYSVRKRNKKWLWLSIVAVVAAFFVYYTKFNPQEIVEQTELKSEFSAEVREIIAPESKIKAYLVSDNTNPIVSMNFIFANRGSAYDKQGKKGIANLVAGMLVEGSGKLDSKEFKEKLANLAVSISFQAEKDDFSGEMLTTKENLPEAVKLLQDVMSAPRFDNSDIERLKKEILQTIDYLQEKPAARLDEVQRKLLFGKHPYSYLTIGTKKDVSSLKKSDLLDYVKNNLTRNSLHIGIVGDVSENEATKIIDDIFAKLPAGNDIKEIQNPEIDYSNSNKDIYEEHLPQVITSVTAPSVARQNKDFYPLYIANYIFGGAGLNSRINKSAREEEGLTYGAYTGLSLLNACPLIQGGFSTTPENLSKMKDIFIAEWQKMGTEGISEKELRLAKNYLQSSYNLRFADITVFSAILAQMQNENLGIDFLQKRNQYIENVTLERVNLVAKKYFSPEKLIMINLGKTK
ncbi:MAG: insulinase family protein [Alphaproteobacteria bacterium]|nr:insulinase family protein [Alphaproteobacteria bacterium]